MTDQWTPSGPLTPPDDWGSTCGCAPGGGPASADNVVITGSPGAITSVTGGLPLWSVVLNDGTPAADFRIDRYYDTPVVSPTAGTSLFDSPMTISRATGVVTFNEPVMLDGDPTAPLEAATKAYVDSVAGGIPDAPNDGTLYGRQSAAWAPFGGPYLPLTGGAILGNLSVSSVLTVLGSNSVVLNAVLTGQQRAILAQSNGSNRWQMILADGTAESGSDSGSNFALYPISDANVMRPAALAINRATGLGTVAADPTAALGIATKAYVDAHAGGGGPAPSTTPPLANGVAAVGTATTYARADHVHPTDAYPHDNRLINGDMRIDQRWNGVAQTAVFSYTVDRWEYRASQAAKGSWGRAAGPASQGFPYALAFVSSTAYAVIANDYFLFDQLIEADMLSDFAFGSANAQPVTLSFVAQSSLTGTFCGAIQNFAQNRSYVFTYSIPVAGVATKISVTIPGDTGGAWVLSGNAGGARVVFTLAAGSGYSATPNAWSAGAFFTAAGAVSVVATNTATFFITGVKLEIGSVATPFNRQSLAKSLADCQRYYYQPTGLMLSNGYNAAAGQVHNSLYLPVAMRVAPTVTPSNQAYNNASGLAINNVDLAFYRTSLSITAVGYGYCNYNATFSAEL